MDMRRAQHSYQANLKVPETMRGLAAKLLEMLRGRLLQRHVRAPYKAGDQD